TAPPTEHQNGLSSCSPKLHCVLLSEGDGFGPEVAEEGIIILSAVVRASSFQSKIAKVLTRGCSINIHGNPLTADVLELAGACDSTTLSLPKPPTMQPPSASLTRPEIITGTVFVIVRANCGESLEINLSHQLADSAAMSMMKAPTSFNGVAVMDNTFEDILSNVTSVVPGSLGLLQRASLSG
ncbi:3-isopropylmalate dehydrogenase Leu1, partial [Diplocarpon mali]